MAVRLKAENLVFELANRTSLGVAKRLGGLLHRADHRGSTTHENPDIVGRARETFLELSVLALTHREKRNREKVY